MYSYIFFFLPITATFPLEANRTGLNIFMALFIWSYSSTEEKKKKITADKKVRELHKFNLEGDCIT